MHTFDRRAGYDDAETRCTELVLPRKDTDVYIDDGEAELVECGHGAYRRPYYEDTGVQFTGTGFTQTIIPPAKPQVGTIKGEPTSDWFEKLDRHAERVYQDDENVQPYRKEQAKKMIKEVDRGAIA